MERAGGEVAHYEIRSNLKIFYYMKKLVIFCSFLMVSLVLCQAQTAQPAQKAPAAPAVKNVKVIDKEQFLKLVYNFEKNPSKWTSEGELPVIVDFYADWCGPCRMISPILEELATEYKGKIVIYKVDTEKSRDLSATFGIRSLPTLFFCPVGEQAQAVMGALPKEQLKELIETILLKNK